MAALPDRDYDTNAEILYALAHTVRLQILCSIKDCERAVSDIEDVTGITQPRLSQQLAILRKADLVETRREGKQVLYRVNQERMRDVSEMLDSLAGTVAVATGKNEAAIAKGGAARFAKISR
jgi:DNA-binding transcriptional ArsR family regulator